jgi:hypothetical protein
MSPVDYNSWIETDKSRKLTSTLSKDIILAEGQYHRSHNTKAI